MQSITAWHLLDIDHYKWKWNFQNEHNFFKGQYIIIGDIEFPWWLFSMTDTKNQNGAQDLHTCHITHAVADWITGVSYNITLIW